MQPGEWPHEVGYMNVSYVYLRNNIDKIAPWKRHKNPSTHLNRCMGKQSECINAYKLRLWYYFLICVFVEHKYYLTSLNFSAKLQFLFYSSNSLPAKHISLGIIRDNTCRVSRLFRIFLSANAQYAGIALSWKWLINDNLNPK